jgi:predicted membrane protein
MSFFEWVMLFFIIGLLYFVSNGRLSLPVHWEDDYSKIVLLIAILFLYNNISLIIIVFLLLGMIYMKSTSEQKARFIQSMQYYIQTPPNQWFLHREGFISMNDVQEFVNDIAVDTPLTPTPIAAPALYSMESEENMEDIALKQRLDELFEKLNQ